jgi:hypothetical protein
MSPIGFPPGHGRLHPAIRCSATRLRSEPHHSTVPARLSSHNRSCGPSGSSPDPLSLPLYSFKKRGAVDSRIEYHLPNGLSIPHCLRLYPRQLLLWAHGSGTTARSQDPRHATCFERPWRDSLSTSPAHISVPGPVLHHSDGHQCKQSHAVFRVVSRARLTSCPNPRL